MVIKVYLSGISASKEVKKRQQRALLILDSCKVDYESIDITEPGMEEIREFMTQNSKVRSPNKTPAAPQFFNEETYCGDYEDFDSAVEVNQVLPFLKLESDEYSLNGLSATNGHAKEEDNEVKEKKGDLNDVQEDEDEDEGESKERVSESSQKDEEADEAEVKEDGEEDGGDSLWAEESQDDSKKRKPEQRDETEAEAVEEVDDAEGEIVDETNKRMKVDGENGDAGDGDENLHQEDGEKDEEKREEGDGEEEEGDFWGGND